MQYVSFDGQNSGPLLFIIYTNDLPTCLKRCKTILFADDTTIYKSSNDIAKLHNEINKNLHTLTDWFCANKLSLNISKTTYLIFNHSNNISNENNKIHIAGETINRERHTKFLGLYIDDKLNWDRHLMFTKKKLSSSLYVLNSVKHLLHSHHLKMLYYTLISPYINYGILLWGSASKRLIKELFIKQKKAIRIVNGSAYNATAAPIFKSLCIPTLHDMYNIELNKLMYSFYNHTLPLNIQTMFNDNKSKHQHFTRHRHNPQIAPRRTAFAGQTFLHRAPKQWHILPNDIKMAKNIKSFKKKLKAYINTLS